MAASGDGPASPRQWGMLVAGVAVASSALSVVGVLGLQHLNRRRRRHELESDVWQAAQQAQRRKERGKRIHGSRNESKSEMRELHASNESKEEAEVAADATPRYLASFNASNDVHARARSGSGATTPARAGSPLPSVSRTSSARHVPGSSSSLRDGLPATSSSRKLGAAIAAPVDYDESLVREQLSRNYSFLGDEAMQKLRGSFVIVVGAGGVGSWCAIMLLRSGVGRLRLIDFDQVSLSSLNRHACATLADVGRPKVTVCKEKFAEIAPWADVDARVEIFRGSEASRLLGNAPADPARNLGINAPTYIVDCIDNLDTKVDLLDFCYKNGLKCFSSMGAGAKADPSLIQVGDLNTTTEDPLARRVRRALRGRGVWGGGVLDKQPQEKDAKTPGELKKKTTSNGQTKKKKKQKEEAAKKRTERERQSALETLEGTATNVARKLQDSGRAPPKQIESNSTSRVLSLESKGGRRSRPMSRRQSSDSSRESMFFSPMSSPAIDMNLDTGDDDDSSPSSPQPFRLRRDEEDEGDTTMRRTSPLELSASEEKASTSEQRQRPSLATLQPPDAGNSKEDARRHSSLQELVAEDTRSSQSGEMARPESPNAESVLSAAGEAMNNHTEAADGRIDKSKPPHTIMCVYTNEKSDTRLLPLDEEEFKKGNVDELAALEDFRVRILPVLGPLPAMFGLAAATYVLCDIAGKDLEPLPGKNLRRTADRMWKELETTERKFPSPGSGFTVADRGVGPRRIPWTIEDVMYVFEEVYRCRSVVPPHETLSLGRIMRWDSTLPLSYSNVALFSKSEGIKHENEVLKNGRSPVAVWGDEAARIFKRRMADERRMNKLR